MKTYVRELTKNEAKQHDFLQSHIIQSFLWGDFRKKTGVSVKRVGLFKNNALISSYQITFHKIPKTNFTVGYLPKSNIPESQVLDFLHELGQKEKAIFIKIEPNIEKDTQTERVKELLLHKNIVQSPRTIFAPNTFLLDLTKTEEELFSKMHPKTRYNIRLAQKHGIVVEEKDDEKSLEIFLKLQRETAKRQKFYIHPDFYYKKMWQTLKPQKMVHLLLASYKKELLVTWMLFRFKDTIYYPYGGSAEIYKNLMASNLVAWEAIGLGKKLGCKVFDFWGALGENPDPKDPWYGFHRFKAGYGGRLAEFVGTYDLVINPLLYQLFLFTDKLRWIILRKLRG
jgi:lipid II:glycine glycyltransferase (peptidoglycan interpeptide bridge formation enzyme)